MQNNLCVKQNVFCFVELKRKSLCTLMSRKNANALRDLFVRREIGLVIRINDCNNTFVCNIIPIKPIRKDCANRTYCLCNQQTRWRKRQISFNSRKSRVRNSVRSTFSAAETVQAETNTYTRDIGHENKIMSIGLRETNYILTQE